jgi:hypothetical protein
MGVIVQVLLLNLRTLRLHNDFLKLERCHKMQLAGGMPKLCCTCPCSCRTAAYKSAGLLLTSLLP